MKFIKTSLLVLLSVLFILVGCDRCKKRAQQQENPTFNLTSEVQDTTLLLGKSGITTQVILKINPVFPTTEEKSYHVLGWKCNAGAKGKLTSESGEEITAGHILKQSDNLLHYTPQSLGKHILSMEVSDEIAAIKKTITFQEILVQKKEAPFNLKLTTTGNKQELFTFESMPLLLDITSTDQGSDKLTYKIKQLKTEKGTLQFKTGEDLKEGDRITFGSHELIFKPSGQIGDASIQLTIENEEDNIQHAKLKLTVQPVKFASKLTSIGGNTQLFPFQSAPILLELSSSNEEADKLTYKIKQVKTEKGKLIFKAGEELKEGNEIYIGSRELVFMPSGETGDASVQLTIENQEGTHQKVKLQLLIQPVKFDLKSSLELIKGDLAQLRLEIPKMHNELDKESFKIIQFDFSDGIFRELYDEQANPISSLLLKPGYAYLLNMPLSSLSPSLTCKVKIEHSSGIHEKEIPLAELQNIALKKKKESLLNKVKQVASKTKSLVLDKHDTTSYGKLQKEEDDLKKSLDKLTAKKEKIESLGLGQGEIVDLDKSIKKLSENLSKIQSISKEVEEKKFAFTAHLQADKPLVFPYQKASLLLNLNCIDAEAKKLSYKLQRVNVEKGTLQFKDGQRVEESMILPFGNHPLIFTPSGEEGETMVKLTLVSEKGLIQNTSTKITIKPIVFDLKSSLELIKGDLAQLRLEIPKMHNELDKESFKIIQFDFSDGIFRELYDEQANPISSLLLKPGHAYPLNMPLSKLSPGLTCKVKIEHSSGIHEKEIPLAELQNIALKKKKESLLNKVKQVASKTKSLVLDKHDTTSYGKLQKE